MDLEKVVMPLLERALQIAEPIVEDDTEDDGSHEEAIVSLLQKTTDGLGLFDDRMLGLRVVAHALVVQIHATRTSFVCGWCVAAAGDGDDARARLAQNRMTLDGVREHAVRCQHNPLVQMIRAYVRARDGASFHADAATGDYRHLSIALDALRAVAAP